VAKSLKTAPHNSKKHRNIFRHKRPLQTDAFNKYFSSAKQQYVQKA